MPWKSDRGRFGAIQRMRREIRHGGGAVVTGRLFRWLCLCVTVLCVLPAWDPSAEASGEIPARTADQPGLERRERPGRDRPELPPFLASPPQQPSVAAPAAPPEAPKEAAGPRVLLQRIRWDGNTVFSDEALNELAAPWLDREVTFEDLQALRIRITRHYIDRGYVNSGAVIPDQEVVSGRIRVKVVEGRLAEVAVSGNSRLKTSYVRRRLAAASGPPLNLNELQSAVQILHQNPLIDRVDAELRPGLRLGEALLAAEIKEASPYVLGFEFGNNWSPRIGSVGGELYTAHRNLTGRGDTLGLRYAMTRGFRDIFAYYNIPVSPRDTLVKFWYEYSDADVVEDPFDDLDITGQADTFAVEIAHPVYRRPNRELVFGLRGELRHSDTTLLDQPYSFSPGVEDGKSEVSVVRFTQEWLSRSRFQVVAVRSIFSLGIDAFDATIHEDDLPDGRFFSWLGQFQWAGRLSDLGGSQFIFRTDMQFCNQSVLPLEKFSVGGAYSVRGYREDTFVRDDGLVASLEFRYPAFRVPIPRFSRSAEDGMVQLAVFADWGWSENVDTPTVGPRTISSAGLGVRWDPSPGLHAQLYWGIPFRDIDYSSHDLQDDGIHFQVNCLVF
jgi:hemolysin activation/secretion protein